MLRRDLADLRQMVDPEHREPALDQMVLIGIGLALFYTVFESVLSIFLYGALQLAPLPSAREIAC